MPTITITFTAPQGVRIAKAFGEELHVGGNADEAQVRGALLGYMRDVVLRQERIAATKAAREALAAIEPIDVT